MVEEKQKYSHYHKDVSHLKKIDVYRVCRLWNVTGAKEHAVKKILCSGLRGVKEAKQDIEEAIASLQRELQMMEEDKHADNK